MLNSVVLTGAGDVLMKGKLVWLEVREASKLDRGYAFCPSWNLANTIVNCKWNAAATKETVNRELWKGASPTQQNVDNQPFPLLTASSDQHCIFDVT